MLWKPGNSDFSLQRNIDPAERYAGAKYVLDSIGLLQCHVDSTVRKNQHEIVSTRMPQNFAMVQVQFQVPGRQHDDFVAGAMPER